MTDARLPIATLRRSLVLALLVASPVAAQSPAPIPGVRAHLRPRSYHVMIGRPVWVTFAIENTTDKPITLTVPGTEPEIPSPEMGLPLAHLFSGVAGSGVTVVTEQDRTWDTPVGYRVPDAAPILILGPHSSVGTSVDLREYFPSLRAPGKFRVSWQPYAGGVESDSILLTVATLKQAEIVTDDGTMTVRFFYEDTPHAVSNFIELAQSGFYNERLFHRVEPGYFIQGGCPHGDGTGIRPDGKRIPGEFNSHPHEKGSVSMALLDDDPDSASCQFFVCNTRQKDWDGRYTVFGQLVGDESLATLDRLMSVPVDEQHRPRRTLYMRSVRIIDAPAEHTPELR